MPYTTLHSLSLSLLSLTMFGCSAGDGDAEQNQTVADDPTINLPVLAVSTDNIQRTAARRVANGMGLNLASLQRLGNQAMLGVEPESMGAQLLADVDLRVLTTLESVNSNFMKNTLGIDDSNAIVVREGNLVTINPDEQRICADEFILQNLGGNDTSVCEQLLQDLSVQIQAYSDVSGLITYSLQNSDVLAIGYSENSASYELQLEGVQHLLEHAQRLTGNTTPVLGTASGALRLSATVSNEAAGALSGELALDITQTLNLVPNLGTSESILLQPSTVFKIDINEATGDVLTSVDWGSLQIMADISEADEDSSLLQLNLGGLTANAALNANMSMLRLTDVGIGDVPLTINVNQIETFRLSLSTFDVTLNAETGMITFDGALGAVLTVSNLLDIIDELGPEASANLSISAAAGTSLRNDGDGSTRVMNNGPLAVTVGLVGNGVSLSQSVSFNEGDCFTSDGQTSNGLGLDLTAIPCAPIPAEMP